MSVAVAPNSAFQNKIWNLLDRSTILQKFIYDRDGKLATPTQILLVRVHGLATPRVSTPIPIPTPTPGFITFVQWALYILFKFVKSLIRHLGLAIGNVRWFSWTLLNPTSIPTPELAPTLITNEPRKPWGDVLRTLSVHGYSKLWGTSLSDRWTDGQGETSIPSFNFVEQRV